MAAWPGKPLVPFGEADLNIFTHLKEDLPKVLAAPMKKSSPTLYRLNIPRYHSFYSPLKRSEPCEAILLGSTNNDPASGFNPCMGFEGVGVIFGHTDAKV